MSESSVYWAASTVCETSARFETWALEVSAVYPPYRIEEVPEGPLADLLKESSRMPKWLYDPQDANYQAFLSLYPNQMLHLLPHHTTNEEQPDMATSMDLVCALHHILYLVQRHELLLMHSHHGKPNESDLCQALDRLASHVWGTDTAAEQGYLFRSQCAVKLPDTQLVRIADATVNSVAFLFDPHSQGTLRRLNKKVRAGLTCMVEELPYLELVHWVMEYKKSESDSEGVQRQVYYGLVSSLWQRRALGRMHDFVFGTAHAESTMTVYAARWEKKDSQTPAEAEISTVPLKQGKDAIYSQIVTKKVHGVFKEQPSSENPVKNLTASPSQQTTNLKAQGVQTSGPKHSPLPILGPREKEYQMVVYEIATYETLDPHDMIQYYLLMRASRKLADDYRREVFQDTVIQLKLKITDPSHYDWPSPGSHRDTGQSGLPGVDLEPNPASGHPDVYAAEPEDEAGWKAECDQERQIPREKYGHGSLNGFSIHGPNNRPDLNDRL